MSVKFPDPMLSENLEYFIIEKRNAEFYQFPAEITLLPVMTAFKEVIQDFTDDYDNNEYLAVKYIRFFTNDII